MDRQASYRAAIVVIVISVYCASQVSLAGLHLKSKFHSKPGSRLFQHR